MAKSGNSDAWCTTGVLHLALAQPRPALQMRLRHQQRLLKGWKQAVRHRRLLLPTTVPAGGAAAVHAAQPLPDPAA